MKENIEILVNEYLDKKIELASNNLKNCYKKDLGENKYKQGFESFKSTCNSLIEHYVDWDMPNKYEPNFDLLSAHFKATFGSWFYHDELVYEYLGYKIDKAILNSEVLDKKHKNKVLKKYDKICSKEMEL